LALAFGHFGIKLKAFFEVFSLWERAGNGVVFAAEIDVDAFEDFVIAISQQLLSSTVSFAEVVGQG
jgi:hypothetical protein